MTRTLLGTPEDGGYWGMVHAFLDAAGITPEPGPEPAPDARAPKESLRATSDWVGQYDDDSSGFPSWTDPYIPPTVATPLDEYAATRSVPDAPQASAGNPRLNPSAYRI